jgi:hypothetical protein
MRTSMTVVPRRKELSAGPGASPKKEVVLMLSQIATSGTSRNREFYTRQTGTQSWSAMHPVVPLSSPLHRMPPAPSDLYAKSLLPKGYGYPLWIPEPNDALPPQYLELGTRVGDVGLVTADGAFDYLFNVCTSPDDPINQGRTPVDFEYVNVLEASDILRTRRLHPPGFCIASATMNRTTVGTGTPTIDNGLVFCVHL